PAPTTARRRHRADRRALPARIARLVARGLAAHVDGQVAATPRGVAVVRASAEAVRARVARSQEGTHAIVRGLERVLAALRKLDLER
ncbi:MAG: hypothetical protein JNL38_15470, partial [Myxococcales bacterium]|nr:hypothetical protein [Myxococcales bacterium]